MLSQKLGFVYGNIKSVAASWLSLSKILKFCSDTQINNQVGKVPQKGILLVHVSGAADNFPPHPSVSQHRQTEANSTFYLALKCTNKVTLIF